MPALDAVGGDQMDLVGVAAHHVARDVVGDDPVAALARALGLRMLDHIFGLGGKADDELRPASARGEAGEDVGILGASASAGGPSAFLSLAGGGSTRQSATAATSMAASAAARLRPPPPSRAPSRRRRGRRRPASAARPGRRRASPRAPSSASASAIAKPCLPDERLAMIARPGRSAHASARR